tara:strand:+ start:248 stop:511 length:264 start_codon:yes stop_codon:yes gene_type:complete
MHNLSKAVNVPIVDILEEVERLKDDRDNLSVQDCDAEMQAGAQLSVKDIPEIQELVDLGMMLGALYVPRGMTEFWESPASRYREHFS